MLAEPDQQAALLDGYLRQLPHDQTVVEFTGNTPADLAIAILAGFNWLVQCAVQAGADPKESGCAPQLPQGGVLGAEMVGDGRRQAALC